ncbi:MAG TPA: hypothetical protein VFA59_09320 [Vicinamibacterales bacterium]|nr:hypothetical protein [Vicinamibacterales bacterium]
MRKTIRRRHDAHARASSVCNDHSAIFDATPGGQKTRTALATYVEDVDRLMAVQERSNEDRRAAMEQVRAGRLALRAAATAVAKVGKLVNLDETTMATMQVPGRVSDDELLAYTRGLLDRVAGHADAFVAEGLPPDLLKHLEDGVPRLAAAKEQYAAARQRFAGALEAIREAQAKSETTIDALEAIAANTAAATPDMLKELRMARRIGPHVGAAATEPPAPPHTTPADKAA